MQSRALVVRPSYFLHPKYDLFQTPVFFYLLMIHNNFTKLRCHFIIFFMFSIIRKRQWSGSLIGEYDNLKFISFKKENSSYSSAWVFPGFPCTGWTLSSNYICEQSYGLPMPLKWPAVWYHRLFLFQRSSMHPAVLENISTGESVLWVTKLWWISANQTHTNSVFRCAERRHRGHLYQVTLFILSLFVPLEW